MKKSKFSLTSRIVLLIDAILIVYGLVSSVLLIPNVQKALGNQILFIVLYVLIGVYTLWEYKRPHGNLLKYVVLLFDVSLISQINPLVRREENVKLIILVLLMMLIAYIAGRLGRIDQNKYLIPLATIGIVYIFVGYLFDASYPLYAYIVIISPVIFWLVLSSIYFVLFKEHKEAGLADAQKNK